MTPIINGSISEQNASNGAGEYTTILDQKATQHILDGDGPKSGGHRYGTGIPGKTEFPQGWSDAKTTHVVSDIATDPAVTWTPPHPRNGYVTATKTVEGIEVKVVFDPAKGRVVSAYPTESPATPRNPKP